MNNTVSIVSILALLLLVFLFYVMAEGLAACLDRHIDPEQEAKRPRYKPIWQLIGILAWNVPGITALLHGGAWAAALVGFFLFAGYGVFRYRLGRSPAMQRCFLRRPFPPQSAASEHCSRPSFHG